ncbi:MAG: A/G-specific adenine glycosylase [Alphaproteobacteria bacterium]|nr:A/G-specific adenine glycosylase [Alphaproteobacteria bacterium]
MGAKSPKRKTAPKTPKGPLIAPLLLAWYDREGRELPWRVKGGAAADPYSVWLSEVMLQQTTVAAVIPYFQKFVTRWPSIRSLAFSEINDVLVAWAGLGYYARARALHACARTLVARHDGQLPRDYDTLLSLPGIGPYTAAAIAAIAFDIKTTPVDGNVERVMARLHDVDLPLPTKAAKDRLRALAEAATPDRRPGDYAQAVMDLGATMCTPRSPRCGLCPLARLCRAFKSGSVLHRPVRRRKPAKPVRYATAFVWTNREGAILLRKRNNQSLLRDMDEVPLTPFQDRPIPGRAALAHAPGPGPWTPVPGSVRHVFTHFELEINVLIGGNNDVNAEGRWIYPQALSQQPLPSVMRKILAHALDSDRER